MEKKLKTSEFIGRQLSRLKAGITYYVMFMSTFTAIGMINLAFPEFPTWFVIGSCFGILVFVLLIARYMDIKNINTMDYQKTVEMAQRYLTTADKKLHDFWKTMMRVQSKWFEAMRNNKPIDERIIDEEYKIFKEGWEPPKIKK